MEVVDLEIAYSVLVLRFPDVSNDLFISYDIT